MEIIDRVNWKKVYKRRGGMTITSFVILNGAKWSEESYSIRFFADAQNDSGKEARNDKGKRIAMSGCALLAMTS